MSKNFLIDLEQELVLNETQKFLCENDLKYLCRDVLKMSDWDICHDELNEFLKTSRKRFKFIALPRGHLKTSILTIGLSIQHILKDHDTRILLANAVWDNARSFLSEIKAYLSDKSVLPRLYKTFQSDRWTQEEVVINQRISPNKTPTYATAGIEKALTSQHYKIIFADDLVNRQNITTEEQREKVKKYYSDLLDLLDPDGTLYIIGTRWHDGDLYGHILRTEPEKFDTYIVGATKSGEIDGELIFPKKFSSEHLRQLLKSKGSYEFYCQYFNKPIADGTQHFKPPARFWTDVSREAIHYVTFDPATSEKKNACDAVVMDCAITGANQLCVVEYKLFGQNKNPNDMMATIFEYVLKYPNPHGQVKKVGIEVNGGQEIYVKLLEQEMRKRNIFFEIFPIRQHIDKFSRIIALQPRWESGNLLLKQGMFELEDQMFRFPVSEKFDVIDTLAMQLQILSPIEESKARVYIPPQYRRTE